MPADGEDGARQQERLSAAVETLICAECGLLFSRGGGGGRGSSGQGPRHQWTVSFGGPRAEGQPAGGTTWL